MTTQRPIILAIDDAPANLITLGTLLQEEYHLRFATSGKMGLSMALTNPPDVILLDIMMPVVDGFETYKRIKAEPQLKDIPVIFITAMTDPGSEIACLCMGAADYITKPINVEIARLRIHNLIERENLRKEVEQHRQHLEDLVLERIMDLSVAKEAAETAHRVKNNFLARMSHELRTPLNTIIGMTEMAMLHGTNPLQSEQLGKVLTASDQLLNLIKRLIDINDLESMQLVLEVRRFKLSTVLDSLARSLGKDAKSKGLDFCINADPALHDVVLQGDPVRLGQILLCMTGNAIKFTQQGSVHVVAQWVEKTSTDVFLRFEVRDTGIGIAPKDQQRIFQMFEQVDDSSKHHYSGVGLGLALSQQLVESMGGTVGLESQPGSGSVFWFTVRLGRVEP
jgi:signal transduction histidine kinase